MKPTCSAYVFVRSASWVPIPYYEGHKGHRIHSYSAVHRVRFTPPPETTDSRNFF